MMKKKQSHWWRMMWIAVTFPLVGIALTAFSKPKEALKEVIDNSVEIIEQPIVEALSAETEEVEVIETPAPAPAPVKEVKAVDEVKPGDKISGSVKSKNGQPNAIWAKMPIFMTKKLPKSCTWKSLKKNTQLG